MLHSFVITFQASIYIFAAISRYIKGDFCSSIRVCQKVTVDPSIIAISSFWKYLRDNLKKRTTLLPALHTYDDESVQSHGSIFNHQLFQQSIITIIIIKLSELLETGLNILIKSLYWQPLKSNVINLASTKYFRNKN